MATAKPGPPELPEPPWRSVPRRGRPPRPELSREAVIDAALAVLARSGPDGLTMRRVATELGTAAASLYGYVANKEELIELVVDRVSAEIPVPQPDGADWQGATKRYAMSCRDAFVRHRGTAGLTLGRVPLGPNSLVRIEAMLAILRQAGIPDRLCGFAGDLFGLYLGAAVHESEAWTGTQDFSEDQSEMMRQWFMSMPPDQFPNLMALADPLAQGTVEERFELGLDVLIRGLASYIP
jgi:AcrR family transcriptional regulator